MNPLKNIGVLTKQFTDSVMPISALVQEMLEYEKSNNETLKEILRELRQNNIKHSTINSDVSSVTLDGTKGDVRDSSRDVDNGVPNPKYESDAVVHSKANKQK